MGIIYKITNTANDKVYIGMTRKTLGERKARHLKDCANINCRSYNYKLYQAMRKIGVDKFKFEKIEECPDNELEEKERVYIQQYDSVRNGYNNAYGGAGKPLWNSKKIVACKFLYDSGWTLQDIAEAFNANPKIVARKLNEFYDIDTKSNSIISFSKAVVAINIEDNTQLEFASISNAARYIFDNHITKSKNFNGAISSICRALNKERPSAYGYKWMYQNVKTPLDAEVEKIDEVIMHKKHEINSKKKSAKTKENYCIDCGKRISATAKRCNSCAQKEKQKRLSLNMPDRETLKNLIRTKSFCEIARMYDVTDNTVRKWCKSFNLPYKSNEIKSMSDEDWGLV